MKRLILKSYPRIQFALQEKIPLSLAVAKMDTDKNLGDAYIRNDEYWNWAEQIRYHSVYDLIENESLDAIKEGYEVKPEDLITAFYQKRGLTPDLEAFILKTWERPADENELKKRLKSWKEMNRAAQKQLSNIFRRLDENLQYLHKQDKDIQFKTSPIRITEFELEGSLFIRAENDRLYPVKAKNGLDIFLNAFTSFQVPFISYQSPVSPNTYIKVYDKEMPFPLDQIKPPESDILRENTINVVVLTQTKGYVGKDSYFHLKIDVAKGTFTFKTKSKEKIPLETIEEHMPLKLTQVKEKNILGEYTIYGLQLNLAFYLDVIMRSQHLREMIYMVETSSFLAIKKKKNLRLKEPNLDFEEGEIWNRYSSFLLNPDEMGKTETKSVTNYFDRDRTEESVLVPARTPTLKVTITKAESRETMQLGLLLFVSTLGILKKQEERLREVYRIHGVSYKKEVVKKLEKGERVYISEDKPITQLQNAAPHIFVTNYSKDICQLPDQPSIIPTKLVKTWNQKQVDVYKRAVPFPYPNEEIYLACEKDPAKAYVSMKPNTLENKEEYPFLPCCTTKNTQEPGSHSFFTHYYLKETLPEEKEGTNVAVIKSRKPLHKNQRGVLHPVLRTVFSHFKISGDDVFRYGVSSSPFGALLCLLFATKDKEMMKYMKSDKLDHQAVEKRAKELLKGGKIEPGLLSQELYDMDSDEIRNYLKEIDFFDTKELYRWLEEYFNLHVFVFSGSPDGDIQIEIPRHRFFSVRRNLNRPCVILYRHWGNKPESVDFPYYDLVMKGEQFTWPKEISTQMMALFHQAQEIYQAHNQAGKTILRRNPYRLLNYEDIFPGIVGQYLDEAGKLRGLLVDVGDSEGSQMTVYVPPGQPLNKPVADYENAVSLDLVLAYFDETPLFHSSEGDVITGVWFKVLDIEEGIYAPIVEMDAETYEGYGLDTKKGRPNPVFAFERSLITEYHQMIRARNVYLATLLWAFFISGRTVEAFLKRYVTIGDFDLGEMEDLNSTLSSTGDIQYAMDYLDATFPFVSHRKFLCEDREMLEKLRYFLETASARKTPLNDVPRTDFLKDLYTLPQELPNYPNTQNFTSLPHFKQWMYTRKEGKVEIIDKLTIAMSLIKNPFLYRQKETGQLFIIQNVSLGEKERAIQNQLEIQSTGNNLGYYTERYEGDLPYRRYIITPAGDMFPGNEVVSDLRLLQYDEDIFASVIPI